LLDSLHLVDPKVEGIQIRVDEREKAMEIISLDKG